MRFIKYLWRKHKITFFLLAAMFLIPFCLLLSITWKLALGFIGFCIVTYIVSKFLFFVAECYDDYQCEQWNKGHYWER